MIKSIMKMLVLGICFSSFFGAGIDARLKEPAAVPASLKGESPHNPELARYYLAELVKEGKMTKTEAERTEVYLIFRRARRMQDLREVEGFSKEERREYMKRKRELRGNPLKEYAEYCGLTMERGAELLNLMHDSDKGAKYYNQYKGK